MEWPNAKWDEAPSCGLRNLAQKLGQNFARAGLDKFVHCVGAHFGNDLRPADRTMNLLDQEGGYGVGIGVGQGLYVRIDWYLR